MVKSDPVVALAIAVFLYLISVPIARRVARREQDPQLERILRWGVVLRLVFAPLSIWVVDHYYHGITDYNRYVNQGALLGPRFDRFDFSLAGTHVTFLGQGAVSVAAGIVFAIVGVDKLAGFFVFGWLAFLGSICFYRAFSTTFPEAGRRRYAKLVFFMPSILFWTAGVSKETVMYVGLGLASYGGALILAQKRGGAIFLAAGTALGIYIRPQEFVLFLSVIAMATLFRQRSRKSLGALRRVLIIGVQVALILAAVTLTNELAKHGSPVFNLTAVSQNNSGESSSVTYHSSPLYYPLDLYHVLLDPLPFNAHSGGQAVAAIENSVLLGIALLSLRRLRCLLRACLLRPYVMACLVYSAVFCYAFASLGNLGLIDRERVLMLPFLLVLFAIPVVPKGEPRRFDWEIPRRKRRKLKARASQPYLPVRY